MAALAPSARAAATSEWLVLVYIAADNNLDPAAIGDIHEMEAAGSSEAVTVAVLMDRSEDADWSEARRFVVRGMGDLPEDKHSYDLLGDTAESMGEPNMGDPATLKGFIEWGLTTHPAKKTLLVLWNHGGGWRDVYARAVLGTRAAVDDEAAVSRAVAGRMSRGIAWDDSSDHDFLEMREVRQVLEGFEPFTVIGMDACLMAMAEVAYEVRKHAEFLVASEDLEPGEGWPYTTILGPLYENPAMGAEELSRMIVKAYGEYYKNQKGTTQSAIRLSEMDGLAAAVDKVAEALLSALGGADATIPNFTGGDIAGVPKGQTMFVDLAGLLHWLGETYPGAVRDAAAEAKTVLQRAVIENYAHAEHKVQGLALFPGGREGADYVSGIIQWADATRWDEVLAKVKQMQEQAPEAAAEDTTARWAVVIGVDEYGDESIPDLSYAGRDAEYLRSILTGQAGYPESNVVSLLNADATLAKVRSTLGTWLPRTVGEDDMVFIYFSGHGGAEPSITGTSDDGTEKYILLHDSRVEDMYSTALPMSELSRIFGRIRADKLILVMDSCYSGASGGRGLLRAGMKAVGMSDSYMDQLAATEGTAILTASRASEVSMESPELGHGIFTYHIGEALGGSGDADNDGIVTLAEVYQYVSTTVPATAKRLGASQNPVLKGEVTGTFPLAKLGAPPPPAEPAAAPAPESEPPPVAAAPEPIRPERPAVAAEPPPPEPPRAPEPSLTVRESLTRGQAEVAASIRDWPAEGRDRNAWIGLYAGPDMPHDRYVSYTFVNNLIDDVYSVPRPMEPGTYQFRLFRDGGYDCIAVSEPYRVP